MTRAYVSKPPPGAKPTTMLRVLPSKKDWAWTMPLPLAASTIDAIERPRRLLFMQFPFRNREKFTMPSPGPQSPPDPSRRRAGGKCRALRLRQRFDRDLRGLRRESNHECTTDRRRGSCAEH